MADSPLQGDWKDFCAPSRDPSSPEFSLTWCLAHLSKPVPGSEHNKGHGRAEAGGERDTDRRSRVSQWRALVAIRTQHIKGDRAGIARFRTQGGVRPLLELLGRPVCSRKTLDLALSILANCCTELETRVEVRKLDGINILVEILKRNVALETVQNRAARALGNLATDPEGSALIHAAGGVPLLLLCVSLSSGPSSPTAAPPKDACPKLECAQSATRALLYLSDTPSNRLSLLTQGTLSALAPLIAPEYPPALRRAALRTLHELTRGCGVECAREVSRSGVLAQLGALASGESGRPFEEVALKTLANVCSQGCLRPLVGSLGVIRKFAEEVKREPLKSGVFLKALCLCCKEAVNRAKVKESGGLEVLTGFLAAHQRHPLSRLAIQACVDFVFDEAAMEQLQELGLVPLLVARLVELAGGEEQSAERTDASLCSGVSPGELPASCFDSFDFPAPEGCRRDDGGREQGLCSSSFLSLRSWLVSEGLISSEGDLLDSPGVDGEWASPHITPSSSPQTSSPNPESLSSLKNSSLSSSTSKKSALPSLVSSVAPPHPSPSPKTNDPPPPSLVPPQAPPTSSVISTPSKTTQTPVSPSKFSSPHRRRQRPHPAASLTKVTLDVPPSASRPAAAAAAYHHPYHPEPWTPESPILLLLSRFSHATDPSAALVSSGAVPGLLRYLTRHRDPSGRCLRMLCRLSCNPNCLQALVRTGSVALIHHHLCQRGGGGGGPEGDGGQTDRVKAKVKQLGASLLGNLRVQCESGFGSGVLAHVMLSGSEADRVNCALSLPLISSNKSLLKKLLLDSGGLLLALQPLGGDEEDEEDDAVADEDRPDERGGVGSPRPGVPSRPRPLYFSLLVGCLSSLMGGVKMELDLKSFSPGKADRVSPPPSKKPRLGDLCPYGVSRFDLALLLDDGTRVPANREAVVGGEDTGGVGSEYFRALLRGGFGEARGNAEDAIPIKDVSAGMLLPILHYLHGCRLAEGGEGRGRCRVLDELVLEGLGIRENERRGDSAEDLAFPRTALGEAMVGACRFLVAELQRELEELCVSLLLSCAAGGDDADRGAAPGADRESSHPQSVEESLASRTSELELTSSAGVAQKTSGGLGATSDQKGIKRVATATDKPLDAEKSRLRPKTAMRSSAARDSLSSSSSSSSSGGGGGDAVLSALLPQLYWFSQRYCYPALGRACLSLLAGGRDRPPPFPSASLAGDCLRRVAREADCTETLRRDLLSLAAAALS